MDCDKCGMDPCKCNKEVKFGRSGFEVGFGSDTSPFATMPPKTTTTGVRQTGSHYDWDRKFSTMPSKNT